MPGSLWTFGLAAVKLGRQQASQVYKAELCPPLTVSVRIALFICTISSYLHVRLSALK